MPDDAHDDLRPYLDGRHYSRFGFGVDGYGLLWTDAESVRTGRAPVDLFTLPESLVTFDTRVRVESDPFARIPSAAFLTEEDGAADRVTAVLAGIAHGTQGGRDFLTLDATVRRSEAVLTRMWKRLTAPDSGPFTFAASALMVLAAETEPHVSPREGRQTLRDGTELVTEWYGVRMLRDALRYLWDRAVSGTPAADVLDQYDDLTQTYPVPVALGAVQRSVLAYCLTERDEALPEARRAEADWRRAEVELERLRTAEAVEQPKSSAATGIVVPSGLGPGRAISAAPLRPYLRHAILSDPLLLDVRHSGKKMPRSRWVEIAEAWEKACRLDPTAAHYLDGLPDCARPSGVGERALRRHWAAAR